METISTLPAYRGTNTYNQTTEGTLLISDGECYIIKDTASMGLFAGHKNDYWALDEDDADEVLADSIEVSFDGKKTWKKVELKEILKKKTP